MSDSTEASETYIDWDDIHFVHGDPCGVCEPGILKEVSPGWLKCSVCGDEREVVPPPIKKKE